VREGRILGEAEELKKTVDTLRDLGKDWKENITILDQTALSNSDTLLAIKRLCKENQRSTLIEIGLACIAFPDPLVSDVLGSFLIAAGLIQKRIKNSGLYLEDVNNTLPNLFRELREIKRQII
jgi:hypothetical protein